MVQVCTLESVSKTKKELKKKVQDLYPSSMYTIVYEAYKYYEVSTMYNCNWREGVGCCPGCARQGLSVDTLHAFITFHRYKIQYTCSPITVR